MNSVAEAIRDLCRDLEKTMTSAFRGPDRYSSSTNVVTALEMNARATSKVADAIDDLAKAVRKSRRD